MLNYQRVFEKNGQGWSVVTLLLAGRRIAPNLAPWMQCIRFPWVKGRLIESWAVALAQNYWPNMKIQDDFRNSSRDKTNHTGHTHLRNGMIQCRDIYLRQPRSLRYIYIYIYLTCFLLDSRRFLDLRPFRGHLQYPTETLCHAPRWPERFGHVGGRSSRFLILGMKWISRFNVNKIIFYT